MSFSTSAAIQNGYYGRWVYDKKNKTSNFLPLGKAVYIDFITDNIEDGDTHLGLSFDYIGEPKHLTVLRSETADNTIIQTLARKGADVSKKHADVLVDTLRLQEANMEVNGKKTTKVYNHLGWIQRPVYDDYGVKIGSKYHYRAATLLGGLTAKYDGSYSVTPMGSFSAWKDMVKADVVGNPAIEVVLIASLSAVVNGLIAPITTGENPIVHLCTGSGLGKTTALDLASSAFGVPFDGERKVLNKYGEPISRRSIYGSWGATESATVTQCAGNRGAVIIFNELGKFKGRDMSHIVYNLSEGTDKARLDHNMKAYTSETYFTTFLSAGEVSLLGRCVDRLEGLQNRVMEIEQPLTNNAEHSRRIKECSRSHNGWAAPVLAQYILDNGALDLVLPVYKGYCDSLMDKLPDTPSKARFVEKFVALFMTTAELASKALDIPFDMEGILNFFVEYENSKGQERNTSANSYEVILEACRTNKKSFYMDDQSDPVVKSYGRITYPNRILDDGKVVTEEYAIRRSFLEQVLRENNYPNIKTCAREWKTMGVLDYEAGHLTRSRKIDPAADPENVFVFRVFGDTAATPRVKPKSSLVKAKVLNSKMKDLLADDEGGEEDD